MIVITFGVRLWIFSTYWPNNFEKMWSLHVFNGNKNIYLKFVVKMKNKVKQRLEELLKVKRDPEQRRTT